MAKSETGWTKQFAKLSDGWYWSRKPTLPRKDVLHVVKSQVAFGTTWLNPVADPFFFENREWLGPISPLDFEQLTRLREAVETEIHRQCAHCKNGLTWTDDGRAHYGYEHQGIVGIVACTASRELREALAQRTGGGES